MVKVRMLTSIAAADWSFQPQQIVEVTEDTAEAWISADIAAPYEKVEENVEEEIGDDDEEDNTEDNKNSDNRATKFKRGKKSSKS